MKYLFLKSKKSAAKMIRQKKTKTYYYKRKVIEINGEINGFENNVKQRIHTQKTGSHAKTIYKWP